MTTLDNRLRKAKYIKVRWNGWDFTTSPILDDEELQEWLRDGSIEEGDVIVEVSKLSVVKLGKNGLFIRDKEKVVFT